MTKSVAKLESSWQELWSQVNARLETYMRLGPDCPDRLRESMSYSLLAGGKRLRPVLVLLSCEACEGEIDSALPAACAIEMVHTYSLIHDDLPSMDDDNMRRGRPTNHVAFDEATAVLAGDGLLTLAFEIIAAEIEPRDVAAACCVDLALAAGVTGMVGGQVADLEAEQLGCSPAEFERQAVLTRLESVHQRKTGRLLCCALTMGARVAGADDYSIELLQNYGRSIGLAFQIADDLLDLTSTTKKMGKEVQKDAGQGKLTYPSLMGQDTAREQAQALIDQACSSIAPLGDRGRRLEALARFVLEREH